MIAKRFFHQVARDEENLLEEFVGLLRKRKIAFCVIGGLGVNAYAEPVVSLDLDVVVVSDKLAELIAILRERYDVQEFPHSINVGAKHSDLRIQIQKDGRYQDFLRNCKTKTVLGYEIPVARIEDVFQGKVWAATDKMRRASKRQKDLADILRLIEVDKELEKLLPPDLKKRLPM